MAITGNFTTVTPVPATPSQGSVSPLIYHVAVTTFTTFTAGTWGVPHGLPYTPTWCVVIPRMATGGAPTTSNAVVGWSSVDTDATHLAIALLTATSLTYDVIYGASILPPWLIQLGISCVERVGSLAHRYFGRS